MTPAGTAGVELLRNAAPGSAMREVSKITKSNISYELHMIFHKLYENTMDGNDAAFSPTPSEGKQWVLDKPKILLFETNWHEDSHEKFVALKLQGMILKIGLTTVYLNYCIEVLPKTDEVPISAAISLQKGSEFLHLFNYNLKKLLERGIIFKLNREQNCQILMNT